MKSSSGQIFEEDMVPGATPSTLDVRETSTTWLGEAYKLCLQKAGSAPHKLRQFAAFPHVQNYARSIESEVS